MIEGKKELFQSEDKLEYNADSVATGECKEREGNVKEYVLWFKWHSQLR